MKGKESTYYKLYRFAFVIIASLVVILGIFIISLCSAEYKREQMYDINSLCRLYTRCISEEYKRSGDGFLGSAQQLSSIFMNEQGIRIYLYNNDGYCIIAPDNDYEKAPQLSSGMMSDLDSSNYLDVTSAALSSKEPSIMIGSKLYLAQGRGSYTDNYIVAYGSTEELNAFTLRLTLFYVLTSLAVLTIVYLLLRSKVKKHSEFETRFLNVLEKYSKGDYSEKIDTDLSSNLQHITAYVNAIAANVEKSDEKSSTFIANVSHELRTPITTIGGFVDGILDGTIKKSRQQEYLVLVSQEIRRLKILITSMLNMSKFEAGTMIPNFRETNLTDLVIKTVLMFEKRIEDKHLEVEELDSSRLTAIVDADLMQQVIYNLVENAVKFVNEGGKLSFSFDKNEENICVIGIRNTGEGLTDTEIRQVFDRFYKTDSSRGKDTTGLGLGLSISRKIVHLHNGHIVVKSAYGEYTEFQIQIPEDPRGSGRIKKI